MEAFQVTQRPCTLALTRREVVVNVSSVVILSRSCMVLSKKLGDSTSSRWTDSVDSSQSSHVGLSLLRVNGERGNCLLIRREPVLLSEHGTLSVADNNKILPFRIPMPGFPTSLRPIPN